MRTALFLSALVVALAATSCFLAQGGFGGGHGDLDRVLFALALPWSLIPWPQPFVSVDFGWLILMPFILNVTTIAVGSYVVRRIKQRERPAGGVAQRH